MPVNPNEAPAGFIAVPAISSLCSGCAFSYGDIDPCLRIRCLRNEREDGERVIFVQLPGSPANGNDAAVTSKPATANFPHDDMGTPV